MTNTGPQNAHERIAELEGLVEFLRGLNKNTKWLYDNAKDRIRELYRENIELREAMVSRPGASTND